MCSARSLGFGALETGGVSNDETSMGRDDMTNESSFNQESANDNGCGANTKWGFSSWLTNLFC